MTHWLERLNAHPRGRDGIVATVWLILGLAFLQFGGFHLWSIAAVLHTNGSAFLLILLAMVALSTQRSSHPFLAIGAGAILTTVDVLFGGSIGVILIFTDLLYAAFKYGSDRGVRTILWVMVGIAMLTAITFIAWPPENEAVLILVVQWALIVLIAAMWGWNVRSERLRTRALMAEDHARATQHLRRRIAHDLHDLVANQIAVAGLHVEAAKLQIERAKTSAPDVARSLEQAVHGTDQADQQLRRMILVLNAIEDLGEGSQAPSGQLVDDFLQGLGRSVPGARKLDWSGAGPTGFRAALFPEPEPRVRLILRVLSELTANSVKHGRGDVRVNIDTADGLTIEVTNDISSSPAANRRSGIGITGAGLLLKGSGVRCESRARESGTEWRATLTVPANGGRP
ncbi:MAG: sensor histidine kinase [Leucobacter sp.]